MIGLMIRIGMQKIQSKNQRVSKAGGTELR